MRPDDIDDLFAHASAQSDAATDRAAIDRARAAVLGDLRPARPMASNGAFAFVLFAVFLVFAVSFATFFGIYGVPVLSPLARASIFGALVAMAAITSIASARTMRPASGWMGGSSLLFAAAIGFPALFAGLFHGYGLAAFVRQGVPCLRAGLIVALPASLVISLILRRGFVLSWTRAGLVAGVLSGLAGLAMLELHCPNLKAIHVIVWHVAVVVTSGLLGGLAGKVADVLRRRI